MIYQVGDTVLYGSQGVCRITEISEQNYGTPLLYYVLQPLADERSMMYVPVDNAAATDKLRHVLSVPEVNELIKAMPDENTIWIENEAARREKYRDIISRGSRLDLVKLIKTIYQHSKEQKGKGKKLLNADERFLKDAEKILYDEFAHVLNLKPEQVLPFIAQQLDAQEGTEAPALA